MIYVWVIVWIRYKSGCYKPMDKNRFSFPLIFIQVIKFLFVYIDSICSYNWCFMYIYIFGESSLNPVCL